MSSRGKLAIAFALSIAILGGILYLLLREHSPEVVKEEGPIPASTGPREAAPGKAGPEAAPAKPKAAEVKAQGAPAEGTASKGGWLITGRIVRESAGAGGEVKAAAGAAAAVPAEGVVVHMKPHPRNTKPGEGPPPASRTTGPDGRFEFAGVPGRVWMRMEIDEPSSAFRTISFSLSEPQGDARQDLGDIPLEAACTLVIQLIGPEDEPVKKGSVLAGRKIEGETPLSSRGFQESRREPEERPGGKYVLHRAPPGAFSVEARAPGYALGRATVELPAKDPLVLRLPKGLSIAGTVRSSDQKPIEGADLQVSGPNTGDPPPKAKSDGSGRFLFDTLSAGEYAVRAEAEGYVSARKENVAPGTEDLEINLAPEAVVSGKVVSEDDGSPIAKARVTLRSPDGRQSFQKETDEKGRFEIRKLPAGTFMALAEHEDFMASPESPIEIQEAGRIADQVIRLKKGILATGKVVDSGTQAAVPDAQVTFQLQAGSGKPGLAKTAKAGPEGAFEVKGLTEGRYILTASAKGFLPEEGGRAISISAAGERDFTIELERGASISGRVLTLAGEPIPGATVRPNLSIARNANRDNRLGNRIINLTAQTDQDGRYLLEGLHPHSGYMVMASHRDFAAASVSRISLKERESLENVDLNLSRGGRVRGKVLDPEGKGIPGANIWGNLERNFENDVDRPMYSFSEGNASADSEGRYSLAHLAAGTYTITAQAKNRASSRREKIAVAEESAIDGVDFVLGEGETLSGRVVDAEGNPISGASLNVWGPDQNSGQISSDADGRFQAKGFSAGRATVNAGKSGYTGENVEVNIPTGEVLITLKPAAKIIGTVRAKGRDTFPSFSMMATRKVADRGTSSFGSQQNDPTGRFEVEVGEGTYTLQASVPGFAPSDSAPVTVKAGEMVEGVIIDLVIGGTIRGVVVARGSGEPVENASVSYRGDRPWYGNQQTAATDAEGAFTLEGVPQGTIDLVATHPEFAQGSAPGIAVRAGETSEARIEMGAGGGIRGSVSYAGRPAEGASVFASKKNPRPMESAYKNAATDAEGRFEILGLPEGEYLVSASRGGRGGGGASIRRDATVTDGQIVQVDLSEEASIRLSGRVLSGGEPVKARSLQAMQPERGWQGRAEIDGSGNYTLEVPAPGIYHIMIEDEQNGAKLTVEVPEGASEVSKDILLPSGEVPGIVVDAETGAPVPHVQVLTFTTGTVFRSFLNLFRSLQGMARSDDQGRFLLGRLSSGTYSICALAEGYAAYRVDGIAVAEGRRAREMRIALEKGINFQVRVTDQKGNPVPQVMGFLRDQDGNFVIFNRPWMSNQEGLMDFQSVLPGTYQLSTYHQSFAPARIGLRAAPGAAVASIALRPGGKVKAQVVNRQGQPVEGAEVEVLDDEGENIADDLVFISFKGMQASLTGKDGSMTFDQLLPGTYRIAARKGKSRSGEEKLTVAEGQASQVSLTLPE